MDLTLQTPVTDLHKHAVAHLTSLMSKKLAAAVANISAKSEASEATVEDLLNYFPMRYEDRSNFITIDKLFDGIEASVELFTRVSGGYQVGKNRGPHQPKLYIFEISASDADRTRKPVVVFWFVSGKQALNIINYYSTRFSRGTRFVAYGKWEWDSRRNTFALKIARPDELEILPEVDEGLFRSEPPAVAGGLTSASSSLTSVNSVDRSKSLTTENTERAKTRKNTKHTNEEENSVTRHSSPESDEELLEEDGDPQLAMIHTARHVPVYRKLGPFQTKRLREIIYSVLEILDVSSINDMLPAELRKQHDLISRADAIRQIHFPPEDASIVDYESARSRAHRRLIFEEFFWVSFALQLKRGERQKEAKGTVIELTRTSKERLLSLFPFDLTNAQKKVIRQIFEDMQSDAPMNRLIQGDVGSGKTVVAFAAMFAAMENGYQAALMAPTEILAEQHARNAKRFFDETGYRIELLTGSLKASEKRKLHAEIAAGEVHGVVGTQAIIQDAVAFDKLGLAVIDEQHRFGVLQRAGLRALGFNPDIVVMTATPIPRSLAMTVYGDLDVSVIDEMPPGRTPIKTVVVGEDKRAGVYKGIEREISIGRQVYIVYPLIEESEKLDLKAATKMYEELRDKVFPKLNVGLLHGKMKQAEKEAIMAEFISGKLNILVSTTVIEVGVDVPNASLMIVEHAERFGLSQLHQLRGRVGRGAEQSFCVLLTGDKKTSVARERLGIMEETNDGFRIAEKDLEIRGQGEILGTRQSGIQTFKIGNIVRDIEILSEARRAAEYYLTEKRGSKETSLLVESAIKDARFRLAGIG
jgi:ATP-dependent DNA helicase RecG